MTAGWGGSVLEAHARLGHCPRRPPDGMSPIHPIQSCHVIQAHLVSQANILIDKDGAPRIGGLGNAFTLPNPAAQIVEGRMGTNRFSRACAPELTVPGASRDATDPKPRTKASDMYAFGVMTFEVWTDTFVWYFSVRSLETGSHGTTTIFGDDRDRGDVLDVERGQAIAAESPGDLGSTVVYARTVLAQCTLEAHDSQ